MVLQCLLNGIRIHWDHHFHVVCFRLKELISIFNSVVSRISYNVPERCSKSEEALASTWNGMFWILNEPKHGNSVMNNECTYPKWMRLKHFLYFLLLRVFVLYVKGSVVLDPFFSIFSYPKTNHTESMQLGGSEWERFLSVLNLTGPNATQKFS